MKWAIIPLFALLLIPASVFGQSETITGLELHPDEQYRESTYIKQQDGYTWEVDIETGELYKLHEQTGVDFADQPDYPNVEPTSTVVQNNDGSFTMTTHSEYISDSAGIYKPYILAQDSDHVQVKLANGKISIDKTECASTYFDIDENIIIKSETYNVRTATIDTDVWNHLDVNDVSCSVTVEETEESVDGFKVTDAVVVTLTKENSEGLFDLEYKISPDGVKTTAYFTNQSYQNNKFAFTQSVQIDDPVITLNGDEYDLSQMRGANFDRETLEQNIDLVLQAKALFFQAGLGFEQLWSVNISDTVPSDVVQVNLDYGRQGENQIAIGETLELDPTFKWVPEWSLNNMDPEWGMGIGTSNTLAACGQGTGNNVYYGVNYLAPFTWNGCRGTIFHFDLSAIPDNATVSDVQIVYGIQLGAGTAGTHPSCNWNSIEAQASGGTNPHGAVNHYSVDWWDDLNNLTTHPNRTGVTYVANDTNCSTPPSPSGGGHHHAHVMDLGTTADTHVQDQLQAGTSVNGVADWFSLGYPFNTVSGTAGTQSISTYNYGLSVTYTTTPDAPTNLATAQTVASQADLTWDAGASNTENWIVGNKAVTYANDIDAPNQTMGWPGGVGIGTAPSLSTSCGVLGQGACFNGITTNIGEPLLSTGSGANNGGVNYTEGTISAWIKPTATGASAGVPFSMSGVGHYWVQNGQWSAYYPAQSMSWGDQYSGPNIYQQDSWTHIVVTIDDNATNSDGTLGTQKMYINGQWVQFCGYPGCTLGPGTTTDSFGKTATAMLGSVYFGGHNHFNSSASYPFEGGIDEYTSWNKVLDYAEIEALFHGTPQDAIDINGASGVTKDNLLNYLDFEENSFPIKNKAHQSDPGTQTFTIIRDGTQIASGVSTESYNDTTVTAPNTYAYTVQGVSSIGTSLSSNTSSITIAGTPDQVTGVTTQDGVPIIIDWTTPNDNGSAITGYNLYRDGTLLSNLGVVLTYSDSAVIGGTTYSYQVSAVNSLGEGPLSAGVNGFAAIPPTAAQNLSASIPDPLDQPHDVVITFDEPSDWGSGTPQSYLLFESVGNNTSYNLVSTVSYSAGSQSVAHSISNIQPITDYYYKVQSESSHSIGPDSNEDNVTTPNVPDTPAAPTGSVIDPVNNPLVIDLTWTNPTSNGGSNIKGWMIERWDNTTGVFSTIVANTGNTNLTYTDSGLNASTDYKYRVSAINNVGTSPASPESATITTPSAPGSPVLTIPSESTTLTWTEPTSTSTITSYNVYRNSALLTSTSALTYVDHSVTMLLPYTYEVAGVSAAGVGTMSNAITTTPRNTINDLFASGTTGTGTILAWTEPPYYQGNVSGYEIQYTTPHGAPNLILTADTGSNIPVFYVSQLSYDTDYSFFVTPLGIAPYDMPPSAASNIINMTTDEDLSITNYTVGQFDLEATNTNIVSTYQFTRTNAGTGANATVTVDVLYPTTYDISCDVSYDMAGTTTTYDSLVVTPINADKDQVSFVFTGTTNDVLTLQCIDQLTGIESTPYIVVQEGNFPLLNQITAFRDGSYGTEGMFGAVDLITIFVVIISMIGFNRINPFVGVFMSVGMLSVLSYFGLIQWVTAMTGALATLFMWAFMRMRAR